METLPWMGPTEEGIDSSMLHLLLMLLLPPSPAWLVRGGGADDAPAMNEVDVAFLVVEAEAAERENAAEHADDVVELSGRFDNLECEVAS